LSAKAWGGRFQQSTDPRVERFTESISLDRRLAAVDIRGSKAHAQMLAQVGLISSAECQMIVAALDQIAGEIEAGTFPFHTELEDIHMHVEQALIARTGDVGRKLHTARSRNDQIATDLKLFVRDASAKIDGLLESLQRAFVARSAGDLDVIVPGYTHLQRAQPVVVVHYWLAYCEKLDRDRGRLADAARRLNVSPLGAAALAGTSLPIDRDLTAKLLEFSGPAANSLDIAGDRDFLVEFLFALSLAAVHLSSWAQEWIVWFSTEFGFLKLPDALTTGSSIMPQKRNPDVLELIRGKSARVIGALTQTLFLLKDLPLAYNRDLQEDKSPLFDAIDTLSACLELAAEVVAGAQLQRERIVARLEEGFLDATALMEYLIRRGVPMRAAHETVGKLVAACESEGCRLAQLPLARLQSACEKIGSDVSGVLGVENAMQALSSYGSGGRGPVLEQLSRWQAKLGMHA
jgi:argininosuccinate lyase